MRHFHKNTHISVLVNILNIAYYVSDIPISTSKEKMCKILHNILNKL